MKFDDVLINTNRGTYCPAGDFYIDPTRPVARAVITHGHADHARKGHDNYLCTDIAAPVLRHRLGAISVQTLRYGEKTTIGTASVSLHPAGHIPGSAQIRVEVDGQIWVASGDYKLEDDGLSTPFEPVRCHTFISECTFGLPVFHWPDPGDVGSAINRWWAENAAANRTSVLSAYSLGKAQRLLIGLNPDIGPILTHASVEKTTAIMREQGNKGFPKTQQIRQNPSASSSAGAVIIAPPGTLKDTWINDLSTVSTAFASGWMATRGGQRKGNARAGFVVSDHADWQGLNTAIAQTGAERILVTHGYTAAFCKWLLVQGYDAQVF